MKISSTKTDRPAGQLILSGCISFLFWCAVWWILSLIVNKSVLLPSPPAVLRVLGSLCTEAEFWLSIFSSLFRVLLGFAAGCIWGVVIASLCSVSHIADTLLSPLMSVAKAVPVASFIILALVWLERGLVPAFIAFLMVLPVITGNVRTGIEHTNPALIETAVIFRLTRAAKIRYLYFPAVLPYFLSGARTSLGLAWKAGVAAEVLCSLAVSIGGNIYESKLYLETEKLFAWTITVILISMLIEKILFRFPHRKSTAVKTEDPV